MKVHTISFFKSLECACTYKNLFGVYVNADFEVIEKEGGSEAASKLKEIQNKYGDDLYTSVMICGDMALFDSEEKASEFYSIFTDEPFENKGVYACIICPKLGVINENT